MRKNAIITGASKGIGYEFARLLAEKKYDLILVDLNSQQLNDAKYRLEQQFGIHVTALVQDLAMPDAALEIHRKIGHLPVEILVNNAGFGLKGKFTDTNWTHEARMIHLHVLTLTQLTKLFLGQMVKRKKGKILNVASLAAFYPGPLMAVYYATKAYILSFSQAIAGELKGSDVTVTVLCPGPTRTGFQKKVGSEQSKLVRWNWLASPQQVAEYGYKAMEKGRSVAIPGRINRMLVILERLISRKHTTAIVGKLQEMNRE